MHRASSCTAAEVKGQTEDLKRTLQAQSRQDDPRQREAASTKGNGLQSCACEAGIQRAAQAAGQGESPVNAVGTLLGRLHSTAFARGPRGTVKRQSM